MLFHSSSVAQTGLLDMQYVLSVNKSFWKGLALGVSVRFKRNILQRRVYLIRTLLYKKSAATGLLIAHSAGEGGGRGKGSHAHGLHGTQRA